MKMKISRLFRRRSKMQIGEASWLQNFVNLITLHWFRSWLSKAFRAYFVFKNPAWASNARSIWSPSKKLFWYDYLNPIYWTIWSCGFSYQWIVSRPYLSLGPGLPALLCILMVGAFSFRQYYGRAGDRTEFYRTVLRQASQSNNDKLAGIALSNLIITSPASEEYLFQQALLDEKLGMTDSATRSMYRLVHIKNHSVAAFWLITNRFTKEHLSTWSKSKHADFLELMRIALQKLPADMEVIARTIMSDYLVSIGSANEAALNLAKAASQNSELLLPTAILYSQVSDAIATEKWADLASRYLTERLLADSNDITTRFKLAQCLVLRKQEKEAVRLLSEGYNLSKDERLLNAGGEAMVAWAARIKSTEAPLPINLVKRLDLLNRAVKLAPQNSVVLEALVQAAIECASNENREVQTLRQSMLRGVSVENLHFIQGTVALLQGNTDEAAMHLELAKNDNPNLPGLLNNMAVALSEKSDPELERALLLSNAAVSQLPNHRYIRETRGQILLALKRYSEAIPDLEFAVAEPTLAKKVHESLAIGYGKLGNKPLAAEHVKLGAELPGSDPKK